MPHDNDNNNGAVGFGRPPKEHQFKSGQSGNPKGRPREPRFTSAEEALARVTHEKRKVRTAKGTRLVSDFERGVIALVKKVIVEQDVRAAIRFLRLCEEYEVVSSEIFGKGEHVPVSYAGWSRDQVVQDLRLQDKRRNETWIRRTEEFAERKRILEKIAKRRSRVEMDGKWRRRIVVQMAYYVICKGAAQGDGKAFDVMHDVQSRYGVTRSAPKQLARGSLEEKKDILEHVDKLRRYRRRHGGL